MERSRKRTWKERVAVRGAARTLPHAFLITGPRGIGKGEAALWIARNAVCEGEERPCGACEPCAQFAKRSDLDLRIVRPISMPFWIDVALLEELLPGRAEEGLAEMARARFLLEPVPRLAGRIRVPLRLNPQPLFKKGKGSARCDREQFATQLEGSPLGVGEKEALARLVSHSFSLDWYAGTVGIGHLAGEGERSRRETGLLSFLRLKPAARRRKVLVVEEAESMTEQAQNALLKTLEEPPENSLLILTAARRDVLFDTIRSRCEEIRLTPLTDGEMGEALDRYYRDLAGDEREELLRLAEGVPGRAAEADVEHHRREKDATRLLVECARSGSFPDYFTCLQEWTTVIEEGGQPLETARSRLTICMEIARAMAEEGSGVPFRVADRFFLLAQRTAGSLRSSANVRLLMEEFALVLREILYAGAPRPAGEGGGTTA